MKSNFDSSAGLALILGSILMVITMVLHPVGGNFDHLIAISSLGIITHSIAIASVPVTTFGLWGLTQTFTSHRALALFAFVVAAVGMFAVMNAAALNGLALPMFILRYKDASGETLNIISLILNYNSALNHAFDFIFIAAISIAILLWSVVSLRSGRFSAWISFVGIVIGVGAIVMLLSGFVFVDLHGFRLFIFAIVAWIVVVGVMLMKKPQA